MNNLINTLESCWYISPPWGKEIPPLTICLLERVYLPKLNAYGYCCGVDWLQGEWSYAIAVDTYEEVIYTSGWQLTGTGQLQVQLTDKPVFALGEKVVFRRNQNTSQMRIVTGIHRVEDFWTYTVEWVSPELCECDGKLIISVDRRAWVTDTDLVRVGV
ncbi:MAG: DUF1392 domain-containing protein [Nostoc sp. LLA-1]|nr:DUF1392 domain-containing protein [Cyanocohniella sp. LLY]